MSSIAPYAHTYNNGQPYTPARGRAADRTAVEDFRSTIHPVIKGTPTSREFIRAIEREMRIRKFATKTMTTYLNGLRKFLAWFGQKPHLVTSESVRDFLETLALTGIGSSHLSGYLTAIRNGFDKMCGRSVTLGLVTPRKPKRLPVVLSAAEIRLILEASHKLSDKILISLMYSTGMRVSEVSRLRWADIDFDRNAIRIWKGKGNVDRVVMISDCIKPMLRSLAAKFQPHDFLFAGEQSGRHVSPRTIQRMVKRIAGLAGVQKHVTPHVFRHTFATHLLEDGTDIRFIQKLLGHVRLETTTIYTKVATISRQNVTSPLDRLAATNPPTANNTPNAAQPPVGRMSIALRCLNHPTEAHVDVTLKVGQLTSQLEGALVREARPGWYALDLPPIDIWEPHLRHLPQSVRDRIQSPEFCENLRREVTRRFVQLRQHI